MPRIRIAVPYRQSPFPQRAASAAHPKKPKRQILSGVLRLYMRFRSSGGAAGRPPNGIRPEEPPSLVSFRGRMILPKRLRFPRKKPPCGGFIREKPRLKTAKDLRRRQNQHPGRPKRIQRKTYRRLLPADTGDRHPKLRQASCSRGTYGRRRRHRRRR